MADEMTVEQEARMMNWKPKDEFRGNPDDWVDAETFVTKGRQILPILQKNNERLLSQIQERDARIGAMETSLKSATAAIDALQEAHDEDTKAQVEAARAELRTELAAAHEAGDHKGAAEITDKLIQLKTAEDAPAAKPAAPAAPQVVKVHPEVQAWIDAHQEFWKSGRRVALANAIAAEKRQAGDKRIGAAFMDEVMQEVEDEFAGGKKRGGDGKVESGSGGSGRSGGEKSYADLPAEAKEACDAQGKKLVGLNRAHKDINSWRASYVKQYFKGETK